MTLAFVFWLFMLLWLIFGVYTNRTSVGVPKVWGSDAFIWILFFLLGLAEFGPPIKW